MKKNFHKYLLIPFALIIGLSGCTKEYYDEHYYVGSEATNYSFTVGTNDAPWYWNESNARYECFFDFEELNNNMYNFGSIVAGVFVNPRESDEWLEMLPYQAVYNDGITPPYKVNISSAFTPGEVAFFLQPSDGIRNDKIVARYEFRVTLMWDEYNMPQ